MTFWRAQSGHNHGRKPLTLRVPALAWFGGGALFLVLGIWEWLLPPLSITVWNPLFMLVYANYGARVPALLYLCVAAILFLVGRVKSDRASVRSVSMTLAAIICIATFAGVHFHSVLTLDRSTSGAVKSLITGSNTVCGSYVKSRPRGLYDAPVWYLSYPDAELVMECGGACMGGSGPAGSKVCTACPPHEFASCEPR
jgi:hypothetical protein